MLLYFFFDISTYFLYLTHIIRNKVQLIFN
jgi:hypothetical protein